MAKIHYTKPSITELEVRYATDAAANGWGERCYEYISRFEELFRSYVGVKHAIATSSCTGALHMGLAALDIEPGDEVILADINWIASAAPITYLKAIPVLVDVLRDSWCLDPDRVEKAITSKTKAIIAVHLYGNLCDMDALRDIGNRHGIPVIEDAAEAIGSVYHGSRAGSMGLFGTFSFHGTKTVTTGEGGMFVTNSDELYEKVLTLSNHGRARGQKKQFWPDMIGYKYKMSNIQAALGCAQLERIESLVERKRAIFDAYQRRLKKLPLTMNPEPPGTCNSYWMPTIVLDQDVKVSRCEILEAFAREGIDGRVFFWPLSSLPKFPGRVSSNTPVSQSVHPRGVNLPSYHDLKADEIETIAAVVESIIQ